MITKLEYLFHLLEGISLRWMKSIASVQQTLVALLWVSFPNSLLKALLHFCLFWSSNLSRHFFSLESYIWWTFCILCNGMVWLWYVGLSYFDYRKLERDWANGQNACCSSFISLSKFELCFRVRASGDDGCWGSIWVCRYCNLSFVTWLVSF